MTGAVAIHQADAFDTKTGGILTASLAFAGLFGTGVALAIDTDQQASLLASVVVGALVRENFSFTVFAFRRAVESISGVQGPSNQNLMKVASEHGAKRVRFMVGGTVSRFLPRKQR